jgi:hypothetical protein
MTAHARQAARLGAGGLALLFAFTTLYVTAFHAPRAKGLDVGVVGSAAQATQLQSALDVRARGALDVRRFGSVAQARGALLALADQLPDPRQHRVDVGLSFPHARTVARRRPGRTGAIAGPFAHTGDPAGARARARA